MPAKPKKKLLYPVPTQHQALYERYLAAFLGLAGKVDPEAEHPEFQLLGAFEGVASYIAYIDIITDVVTDAYMKQLKRLSVEGILPIMGMLDECAQQKAENELFALDEETLIAIPHEHFLTSDLAEEIIEQLGDDSVFKKRPFLFYYALAIMQLSLVFGDQQDDVTNEQQITRFIDMRVCLERAKFTLGVFSQKKNAIHKDVASKGGRVRFSVLYGAAQEYAMKRYRELLVKKPTISKRQAALTIADEAATHPAFRIMSKDNLFETIYRWLREM
jgi:hypothetical protein